MTFAAEIARTLRAAGFIEERTGFKSIRAFAAELDDVAQRVFFLLGSRGSWEIEAGVRHVEVESLLARVEGGPFLRNTVFVRLAAGGRDLSADLSEEDARRLLATELSDGDIRAGEIWTGVAQGTLPTRYPEGRSTYLVLRQMALLKLAGRLNASIAEELIEACPATPRSKQNLPRLAASMIDA